MGVDDEMFAIVTVSLFMQVIGILQMPHFLGPSFNPFAALMALLEMIVKNTLWIEVDRTLNIMPMTFDNKGCHTREDSVLVPVESATAEEPIEYSVTTVATSSATQDVAVNGKCIAYKENMKRETTTPAKRKWQRLIQKRQKSH
jgi:hypothetical protein